MRKTWQLSALISTMATLLRTRTKKITGLFCMLALLQAAGTVAMGQDNNSLIEITGQVNGQEKKEPLSDVSVQVKGTVAGTITNKEGNFKLRTRTKLPLHLFFLPLVLGSRNTRYKVLGPTCR